MDSDNCKFSAQGEVMSAVKGALVLVKGNRIGNLYVLFGNIVTSGVTMSSSNEQYCPNKFLTLANWSHE